jgi:hypothetical protein
MLLKKKLSFDKQYCLLIVIALITLFYFALTVAPRGDEGVPYLKAFNQAYGVWPSLDTSPAWSLSSQYLWAASGVHHIFQLLLHTDIITSGRLFSLICWAALAFLLFKEEKSVRWKATLILFNPYLLIYVTRAHPLMPALFLIYLFWEGVRNKKKPWGIWILFAVTFQVFTGGVAAMLLPGKIKDISWEKLWLPILGGFFAIAGVLLTWIAWGGMYPEAFATHEFFKINHENGTLSFGYISLAFMITGGVMWIIGDRPFKYAIEFKNEVLLISFLILLAVAVLYFGKETIGIVDTWLGYIMPEKPARLTHSALFALMGLGWLRVKRDRFLLLAGVFGCAILMTALPYLYERIAAFGTLAPSLIWVLLGQGRREPVSVGWIALLCLTFLCFAGVYEVLGVL